MNESSAAPQMRVALVVIARNESRCIERCLLSAKPFVDHMLVLDTGSTDDTPAIALRCAAHVHHAKWEDDFSAARNRALDLCDADWNLIMDADEWIESGAQCLRDNLGPAPSLGVVRVRSDYENDGRPASASSWITRVLPRGVRYVGRIHEQPESGLPRVRLPLVIGHDGYRAPQLASKHGRNRALLLGALALRRDDSYLWYQLGKDCEAYNEHADACDHYEQALALAPANIGYRHDLAIRLMHCLGRCGRLDEAIDRSAAWMQEWSSSPDFNFTLGNLMLDKAGAAPAEALQTWLPLAQSAWLRCLEIGERPDLEGSVAGRGSHLAAHNLAVVYAGLGNEAMARRYREIAGISE